MYFENLINNLEQDMTKYNLFDERSINNKTRDIFMRASFIIFSIPSSIIGGIDVVNAFPH